MNGKLVCSTTYFKTNLNDTYQYLDFRLTNDKNLLAKEFWVPTFIQIMGKSPFLAFENFPTFVDLNFSFPSLEGISGILDKKIGDLKMFMQFLWFVKDNSADIQTLYLLSNGYAYQTTRDNFISNSRGEYKLVEFTKIELGRALEFLYKWNSLTSIKLKSERIEESLNPMGLNATYSSDFNFIGYDSQNRIDRAMMFLELARTQSYLPLKISLYMAIYECIFTTGHDEIARSLRERATGYLEGGAEMKKMIKRAYDLRSKFFHGKNPPGKFKKRDDLLEFSSTLDQMTRQLLTKVIMKDSLIFLLDDKKLENWFNEHLVKVHLSLYDRFRLIITGMIRK